VLTYTLEGNRIVAHAALTIAKYFLSIPDSDAGDLMSNLKLQKLLYYAQGYAVAMNGEKYPLFPDRIYAWKHGPVVKTVYNHYAKHGADALPSEVTPSISNEILAFLNEIYRVFGRYSAWALRDMTHREPPWLKNFQPDILDIEIPLADLVEYFSPYVKKAKTK
jgi:uncharacterized phage-associated protein